MAMKPRLGANPLTQGIFSKTEPTDAPVGEIEKNQGTPLARIKNQETEGPTTKKEVSRKKNQEFLGEGRREKVNLQIPGALNDWLDDLIKADKRQHGRKIPKQVWVQGAIELMQAMPVDWREVKDEGQLREALMGLAGKVAAERG